MATASSARVGLVCNDYGSLTVRSDYWISLEFLGNSPENVEVEPQNNRASLFGWLPQSEAGATQAT